MYHYRLHIIKNTKFKTNYSNFGASNQPCLKKNSDEFITHRYFQHILKMLIILTY